MATSLCWPGSARTVHCGPRRRQLLCLPSSPLLSPRTQVHGKQEESPAASGGRHTTLSWLQRLSGVAGEGKALLELTPPLPAEQRPQQPPLPAPRRQTGEAPRGRWGPRAGSTRTIFLAQSQRELSSRAGLQDPFRSSELTATPAQPGGEGKGTHARPAGAGHSALGVYSVVPRGGKAPGSLCRTVSRVWGVPGGACRDPLLSGNIPPHRDPLLTSMPRKSGFSRSSYRKPRVFLLTREKSSHPIPPEVPSAHGQMGRHAPPGQEKTAQQTTGLAAHGGRHKRSSSVPESLQGPAASPGSCLQPPPSEEQRGRHRGPAAHRRLGLDLPGPPGQQQRGETPSPRGRAQGF